MIGSRFIVPEIRLAHRPGAADHRPLPPQAEAGACRECPCRAASRGGCGRCPTRHRTLSSVFGQNFHVRYPTVFRRQKDALVLVKGGPGSRLLRKAHRISAEGRDRAGKPLKVLSPKMREVFGDFGGHVSIQRSPPRWVEPAFVDRAIGYLEDLD